MTVTFPVLKITRAETEGYVLIKNTGFSEIRRGYMFIKQLNVVNKTINNIYFKIRCEYSKTVNSKTANSKTLKSKGHL